MEKPKLETIKYTHSDVPVSINNVEDMRVLVDQDDMFVAVKEFVKKYPTSKVLFHNFANDLLPCANDIIGDSQEVQLFKKTQIRNSLRRHLYPISPGIILTKNLSYKNVRFDVASIAALRKPSKQHFNQALTDDIKSYIKYEVFNDPTEIEITKDRMRLFLKLASNYDFVLTGAWGCGLYDNPIYGLCQYWNELLKEIPQRNVIFITYNKYEYDHLSKFITEL